MHELAGGETYSMFLSLLLVRYVLLQHKYLPGIQLDEQLEHMQAVRGIQVAGRFIGEQDGRANHESAGECDTLLLASGELNRVMMATFFKAHLSQQLARTLSARAAIRTNKFIRQKHILFGGKCRDELIGLEDKADFSAPQECKPILRETRDFFTVEPYPAGGGSVQAGDQPKESAFSTSGRAHDRDELPPGNV